MSMFSTLDIDIAQTKRITRQLARRYRVVPIGEEDGKVILLVDEGEWNGNQLAELEFVLDFAVVLREIAREELDTYLQKYYFEEHHNGHKKTAALSFQTDFMDRLILEAKQLKSSDIHIESFENKGRVRIRIDGMMVERYAIDKADYPALVNKIKIQANLDIAEKRLPQDGRIHYDSSGERFDIRVSVLPTLHGEKVVLRLLNNDATNIHIETLGMSQDDLAHYLHGVKKPNGIMLISGPTGSGKTTTLYATLKYLNKDTTNILTIEDPIEYTLEGINQVQLRESIGLTFGAALRTFLRQDPDIIMVGEIRDPDTANMAIRAALTGHLVLSTIHTNSAWGTVSRLVDMGVPPFLIANTLNTTVAQRLVRLLCPHCKKETVLERASYPKQFVPYYEVDTHAVPVGCPSCFFTGYAGRKAVYEIIPLDRELSAEVKKGNMQVDTLLKARGIKNLGENAFELFAHQQTSMEEIYPLLFNY